MKQISVIVFAIAAITDWYDGWLARKFNYITTWGKFLDPLADKILTSSAFIAFAFTGVLSHWMVWIIVVRDFLITGLRILSQINKKPVITSKTAQWKTFIQMFFIYYLLVIFTLITFDGIKENYSNVFLILMDKDLINISMLAVTIITIYTGLEYLIKNRKQLRSMIFYENKSD